MAKTQKMETGTNQLKISFQVATDKTLRPIEFNFEHTKHSYWRACQRGLNHDKIAAALQYGDTVYKQGLIYYILGEHNIPEVLSKQKDKFKNTVVIVARDSNQLITCYRTASPFKYIRIKSKRLCKNINHAA